MRVLITGAGGFAGKHLIDFIRNHFPKEEIFAINRNAESEPGAKVKVFRCDLTQKYATSALFQDIMPERVFHLAAQSVVTSSWQDPSATLMNNIVSSINVLEALRNLKTPLYNPSILLVGSSEQYGYVTPDELPLRETNLMRPASPYAVSKVTQDFLGWQYFLSYGLTVFRARAFNHSGAGRDKVFVDSSFANQIAQIEKGNMDPKISVGNLEAVRDFSDVRDVVRAYWIVTEKGKPGEAYNVCSGKGIKIRQILDWLLEYSRVKNIQVVSDPSRLRPSDNPILYGSYEKLHSATGWFPKFSFLDDTLKGVLEYWRKHV